MYTCLTYSVHVTQNYAKLNAFQLSNDLSNVYVLLESGALNKNLYLSLLDSSNQGNCLNNKLKCIPV